MEMVVNRLNKSLNLSAGQANQLRGILDEARSEVNQARNNFKDDLFATRRKAITRLSAILTPDQKIELGRILRENSGPFMYRRWWRNYD